MPTDLTQLLAPERNRYFYGLLMDAGRFRKDQNYFNRKRFLLNRFVTGDGVVCGLGLTFDQTKSTLTLSPGLAIDLAGREIVVPAVTPVDITQLTDAQGKPTGPVPAGATILISLAYAEVDIDPVAVLVPDCDHPNGCAPSTIEESFHVPVRLALGPPPPFQGCPFPAFPLPPGAALQGDIANGLAAASVTPASADTSIALGRLTLPGGPLDAVSDRPVVYDNALLYQLIVCLAQQVSEIAGVILAYVSGDNQSAKAGGALPNPLIVGLVDASGNPVTGGDPPQFKVTSGGGSIGPVSAAGAPGQYQTTWTLGSSGAQSVTALSDQSKLTIPFVATIQP
jgi:hypothetical protein